MLEVILKELYSYTASGIKLGLENIEELCNELGNPQKDYKIIHIAGTNGKGSTSTIIEKSLIEAGYKVGKYTSPHILKFNERIVVDGEQIKDNEIVDYYMMIKKVINRLQIRPTFFEITTAMMLKYFSDKKVDYAVIEVGLGGRYDATNIVDGDYAVITNVSFDHMEFLGDTLYQIAKEKAGIIKRNSKTFVGSSEENLIKAVSERKNDYINVMERYKENSSYRLDFERFITVISIDNNSFELSLFGKHQYNNFILAYAVLKDIGIEDEIIKRISNSIKWQGRFEVLDSGKRKIILDGAHNEDSVKVLADTLDMGIKNDDIVAIVSVLKDKEYKKIISILEDKVSEIIFTSLKENGRGQSAKELFESCDNKEHKYVFEDIEEAYQMALKMDKKYILVCGSFYLLTKFKERVLNETL